MFKWPKDRHIHAVECGVKCQKGFGSSLRHACVVLNTGCLPHHDDSKGELNQRALEPKQTQDRKGIGPACPVGSASLFFLLQSKLTTAGVNYQLPGSCLFHARRMHLPSARVCARSENKFNQRALLLAGGVISAVMGSMQCSIRVLAWLGCCAGAITSHLLWLCCYEFKACLSIIPHIIQMAFIPSPVRTRKGNTQNTTAREWLLNRERKGKEKQ